MWDEFKDLENENRNADRERERERVSYFHDVHEPTTYERTNEPMLKKLMGKDWDRFFSEEQYHDHYQDNQM